MSQTPPTDNTLSPLPSSYDGDEVYVEPGAPEQQQQQLQQEAISYLVINDNSGGIDMPADAFSQPVSSMYVYKRYINFGEDLNDIPRLHDGGPTTGKQTAVAISSKDTKVASKPTNKNTNMRDGGATKNRQVSKDNDSESGVRKEYWTEANLVKIVVENDEWTISCFGFEKLSGFKCSPKKVTDGEEATCVFQSGSMQVELSKLEDQLTISTIFNGTKSSRVYEKINKECESEERKRPGRPRGSISVHGDLTCHRCEMGSFTVYRLVDHLRNDHDTSVLMDGYTWACDKCPVLYSAINTEHSRHRSVCDGRSEQRAHSKKDEPKEEDATGSPNMADEWAANEVNEAVDVAPAFELESDLPEVKLFGKWNRQEVNVADISLVSYITVKEQAKRFRKAPCPIGEGLAWSLMMPRRSNAHECLQASSSTLSRSSTSLLESNNVLFALNIYYISGYAAAAFRDIKTIAE
ncbi:hypothetical protein PRIPAC_76261 [Pristionchus pacificus]|uniref:Uncharacterized protein n=1 Tax=Pristionchus pacificus TaxID=54126 RepID=A0A2A6CS77_PRIPA|nr:hypothetical protein PRIPAC_76261 [Pristionchus pacificus]|eukprot:PDM80958.1 hypothetical protein PRIPAC_35961 [Pristionchus pacificus]